MRPKGIEDFLPNGTSRYTALRPYFMVTHRTWDLVSTYFYIKSTGLWRWYINTTITIPDIIHCPVFYYQNSIRLSIPHKKHNTSPLRAQRVNAIYWYVTMIYYYEYHNSGCCPSSWVQRLRLALSIGPNWVGSIWRRRQDPAFETSCLLIAPRFCFK
jgi:hypothetical protein